MATPHHDATGHRSEGTSMLLYIEQQRRDNDMEEDSSNNMSNHNDHDPANEAWDLTTRREFRAAVRTALEQLAERGFSREHAVAVVLRQIQGDTERPTEDECFEFMQKYGLGIQQALFALTVSAALRKLATDSNGATREKKDEIEALRSLIAIVRKSPQVATAVANSITEEGSGQTHGKSSNISLRVRQMNARENWDAHVGTMTSADRRARSVRKRSLESTSPATAAEESPSGAGKRVRADSVADEIAAKVNRRVEASASSSTPDVVIVKATPNPSRSGKRARSTLEETTPTTPSAESLTGAASPGKRSRKNTE